MKVTIPKYFLGQSIEGSLEEVLAGTHTAPAPNQSPIIPIPATGVNNLQDYIILDGKSRGSYSYGDLIVAKHRLGYGSYNDVNIALNSAKIDLGINIDKVVNSSEEADGTKYIGNISWETALKLNQKLGNITLNPRQFIDFLELLKTGSENKRKVYDGAGNEVSSQELEKIYKEIREVREPWRSEWLDAKFTSIRDDPIYIEFDHTLQGNALVNSKKEELKGHVKEDAWIDESSFNHLGLPEKKSRKQTLYYYRTVAGRAAGFGAGSGWAYLSCYWNPTDSDAWLGVRPARKKI